MSERKSDVRPITRYGKTHFERLMEADPKGHKAAGRSYSMTRHRDIRPPAKRSDEEAEQERKLLAVADAALQSALATKDIIVQARVVTDIRALRALANTYKINEQTKRKLGEAALLCLRAFGERLIELYPDKPNGYRGTQTGIAPAICCHAITLSAYTVEDLNYVFDILRNDGSDPGIHVVTRFLKDGDCGLARSIEQRNAESQRRRAEIEMDRRRDADYSEIRKIIREYREPWFLAKEILRLRRQTNTSEQVA